jgi:hypothetical protein
MSKDMFASYLKKRLLKARQTFTRVGDLPKKLATGDKIKTTKLSKGGT